MSGSSAAAAGADSQAPASYIDKWLARWPEWRVAEVFVPGSQREPALAWFALQQELTDAAWTTTDPRPRAAKLAWWAEELQGWSQGRRRHPLGIALQRLPVPWMQLAAGLPALAASRERQTDIAQSIAILVPFAAGSSAVGAALLAAKRPTPAEHMAIALLGAQLLSAGDAAVSLRTRSRLEDATPEDLAARVWAQPLLLHWPPRCDGSIPERIRLALLRERLRGFAAGRMASAPASRWHALWTSWRAARG